MLAGELVPDGREEGKLQAGDINHHHRQYDHHRCCDSRDGQPGGLPALLSLALQLIFALLHIVKALVVIVDADPVPVHFAGHLLHVRSGRTAQSVNQSPVTPTRQVRTYSSQQNNRQSQNRPRAEQVSAHLSSADPLCLSTLGLMTNDTKNSLRTFDGSDARHQPGNVTRR